MEKCGPDFENLIWKMNLLAQWSRDKKPAEAGKTNTLRELSHTMQTYFSTLVRGTPSGEILPSKYHTHIFFFVMRINRIIIESIPCNFFEARSYHQWGVAAPTQFVFVE